MKDTIIKIAGWLLGLAIIVAVGYVGYFLGIKLPIKLWDNGEWGFAIAQACIIWSWLLGGKRNGKN